MRIVPINMKKTQEIYSRFYAKKTKGLFLGLGIDFSWKNRHATKGLL